MWQYNYTYPHELHHHGILGMKWGKRNGPPYPLGASDHSTSEKKAGWRKSLDKTSEKQHTKGKPSKDAEKKSGLTDKQKKAIKIGVAVAATALAAYGTYRFAKSGKLDDYVETGKAKVDELLGSKSSKADNVTGIGKQKVDDILGQGRKAAQAADGIQKLSHAETVEEVISKVNPSGNSNNCYNVVVGTVARLCGLDVVAKGDTQSGKGLSFDEVCKVFKLNPNSETDVRRVMNPTVDRISKIIGKKFTEGDVGAIGLSWNETYRKQFGIDGGHTLNWIIRNGKVEFIDGQKAKGNSFVRNFMNIYLDSGKEVSVAKFANVAKGIDLDNNIDLGLFHKFVK